MGVFRQFPYSNFHEMNMDEMIKIIKNMLEEWAQYHAEWDEWKTQLETTWTTYQNDMNAQWTAYQNVMNEAWQSMQNFINNYFDNLDVEEEINNKIVSMIQTGEFGSIVNEYIPPHVSAWLSTHITQPTGVVIDTSLTVAGACADAKATGDAINKLGFEEIYIVDDLITAQELTLTSTLSAMWDTDGTIKVDAAFQYYKAINQPIKVEAGKTYKFYGIYDSLTNGAAVLFDENMENGLRKWAVVSADGGEYTIPNGYSYICLDVYTAKTLSDIKIIGDVATGKYESDKIVLKENSVKVPMTDFAEYVDDPYWVDTTNMLDNVTWSAPGYMRQTNGTLETSQYTTEYIASNFIAVVPGFKYRAVAESGNTLYAVFFSDLQNDGTNVNLGWLDAGNYVDFIVPDEKTYVSFNCVYNGSNKIGSLYRRTQVGNEKSIFIPKLMVNQNNEKPFSGKTMVNFGDSIFGQARPPLDISSFLAEKTGATVYNAGFGGCQMGYHGSPQYDAFSMYRLAYAVANNDWTIQDDAIANYPSLPGYFAQTVALLKSIDFSEVDIVTISYGTNDFTNGLKIGGSNSYSVDWALDYSIQTLLTAFTNLRIFVCLPMYRVWLNSNNTFDYDSNTATSTSWVDNVTRTFKDFVEAEKNVAEANQTPIIDTYYDLGINKYNWTRYFPSTDGTHHNLNGRKLIAELISAKLW